MKIRVYICPNCKRFHGLGFSLDEFNFFHAQTAKLQELNFQEGKLLLKGTTSNPQHFQAFYKKLQNDAKFKKIDLSELKRQEIEYGFTISLEGFKN